MLRMYEEQPVVYGVIVGDGGNTMIVRGLEIQKAWSFCATCWCLKHSRQTKPSFVVIPTDHSRPNVALYQKSGYGGPVGGGYDRLLRFIVTGYDLFVVESNYAETNRPVVGFSIFDDKNKIIHDRGYVCVLC